MNALGLTCGLMLLAHHVGYPLSDVSWWLCLIGVFLHARPL